MTPEQWAQLLGVGAVVLGALAALVKAVGDVIVGFRRPKDPAPSPETGIPTAPDLAEQIAAQAVTDMRAERDRLLGDRDRALARAETAEAAADRWQAEYYALLERTIDPRKEPS